MDNKASTYILVLSLIFLTFGIGYAGSAVRDGLQTFNNADRTVVMKGLAERDVEADLAIWPLSYTATGNDLTALQTQMDEKGQTIIDFMKKHGLDADEISLQSVNVQDLLAQAYRQNNGDNRYILTQTYLVRSENIEAVDKASKNLGDLIKQNIVFTSGTQPTYLFTGLNDIKPEMIAEATQSARKGAREFAKHSGQKVGGIKSASQGVFQILPRDKTYAVSEAQQKQKKVRVVSTIRFYLEE